MDEMRAKEVEENTTLRAQLFNAIVESDWPENAAAWPEAQIDAILHPFVDDAAALAEKDAEIERLKEDLTLTRGAMDAQDQREREAGERCGVSWLEVGCDWPDWVADEVLSLRANVERLKKDNSGLHEVQDEQRGIITALRAELATAKKRSDELAEHKSFRVEDL